MKREDQLNQLKELIKQLEDGSVVDAGGIIKVPAETYTSEDRFQQEWDIFFKLYFNKENIKNSIYKNELNLLYNEVDDNSLKKLIKLKLKEINI